MRRAWLIGIIAALAACATTTSAHIDTSAVAAFANP